MAMDSAALDLSRVWMDGVVAAIAEHLPANEAANLRFVNKLSAAVLEGHNVMVLSEPIPPWAFAPLAARPDACKHRTREQRDRFICLVAATDVVPNLELALAAAGRAPSQLHLEAAASAGALASCTWLVHHIPDAVEWLGVVSAAAKAGREAVCAWGLKLCPRAPRLASVAAVAALKGGHVALAEELMERAAVEGAPPGNWPGLGIEDPTCRLHALLEGCNLADVARLCVWQGAGATDMNHSYYLSVALSSRTADWLDKVDWVLSNSVVNPITDPSHYSIIAASLPGPATVVRFEWLHARGCEPTLAAAAQAVVAGNVPALEWLLEHGPELPPDEPLEQDEFMFSALVTAAKAGHMAVLQALHQRGHTLPAMYLAQSAAAGGRLELLRWLLDTHEWDAEVDVMLFSYAAESGDTRRMLVVHNELKRPMSPHAWSCAVQSGCDAALELLQELGCPKPGTPAAGPVFVGSPYHRALTLKDWRLVPLLHAYGLPLGRPDLRLVELGIDFGAPVSVLQLLVDAGCEGTNWADALAAAETRCAKHPHSRQAAEVLAWVRGRKRWHHPGRWYMQLWSLKPATDVVGFYLGRPARRQSPNWAVYIAAAGVGAGAAFLLARGLVLSRYGR